MAESFSTMLTGGQRNSLGRTQEVVDVVVADRSRIEELFAAVTHQDELVRMRAGDALEKVCRERPAWVRPYVERLLTDVAAIEQPSLQWHTAQILDRLREDLDPREAGRAVELLQRHLAESGDWIVLNVTMDVLAGWARDDPGLRAWLEPQLHRLRADSRGSVSKRASRWLERLAA